MKFFNRFFGPQDMTNGTIWRKIAAFSIPLLVGNLIQQLYNTVDAIVVGRYVGDEALAAVGTSFPLMFLLLVLFIGVATGTSIMVSQYFGAKEKALLSRTIGTAMVLNMLISVLIMVLGPIFMRPLLVLIKTPEGVLEQCADYLIIISIGITGIAFYNGISGILRGMGDSIMPLAFLTLTCVMNIFLDIWFVAGLGWGVAGAAWATVISQWFSSVLCLVRLMRKNDDYEMGLRLIRLDRDLCAKMTKLSLPAATTQIIFSLAGILVQNLTNTFGAGVMASITIVMRVDAFAIMPMFSFGMAISTFVGQNVGAGKLDRVTKGTRTGLLMAVSVTTAIVVALFFVGRPIMRVFTDTWSIIDLGYRMLCILIPGYIAFSATQILFGVMRGAGDTVSSMWISIITTVAIRTPLAYLLAYMTRSAEFPVGRPEIIVISHMASWMTCLLLSVLVYRRGKWRTKSILKPHDRPMSLAAKG